MPLLRITTNQVIDPEVQIKVLEKLSAETARILGKPEDYVMTIWLPEATMTFAGKSESLAAAYVELDSIGLTPDQTNSLSQTICAGIAEHTSISPAAIYIKFYDSPRAFWGWDGKTFA